MLIAQSASGIVRIGDAGCDLLDTAGHDIDTLLRTGQLDRLRDARTLRTVQPDELTLRSPLARPGKFCIVGLNYRDHAAEIGAEPPAAPRFSYVPGSAVAGPGDDIRLPAIAPDEVDYEGELAVVIGRAAVSVSEADAWHHVAGVTAANDVSARDVQLGRRPDTSGPNIGLGKGFDTFKPLGPALLTTDELTAEPELTIRTVIDGETRQDSTTANLIFGIPALVATISRFTRLDPGDVILTGTPGGVAMTTGRYLRAGQLVEIQVERVGTLRNRVVGPAQGAPR